MAYLLRQLVAGPRSQHPEAGLDLCYVTDNIIVTSGPSATYPQRAYRNPLDALVNFLDSKHDKDWCIWEFRAEGTGYPDSEVYGRIHHYPWPDHHPPPFSLIPAMMGGMWNWVQRLDGTGNDRDDDGKGEEMTQNQTQTQNHQHQEKKRIAVVHCKAGKGRSGTVACSYLISQEGWAADDALKRFTERRMRAGFGAGVSIPSQLRWVRYVDRWAKEMGKKYVERPVEILEVHAWGLRDGVKVAVEGFVDEGKKIKCFHLFHRSERTVVDDGKTVSLGEEKKGKKSKKQSKKLKDKSKGKGNYSNNKNNNSDTNRVKTPSSAVASPSVSPAMSSTSVSTCPSPDPSTVTAPAVSEGFSGIVSPTTRVSAIILRPNKPVVLPLSDVNIDFERRSKAPRTDWAMVTSVAHVWFNAYFEGGDKYDSGIFETDWDSLDGIKGTTKKGIKALERLKVVWRYAPSPTSLFPEPKEQSTIVPPKEEPAASERILTMPKPGEPIPEAHAANWRGEDPAAYKDNGNNDNSNDNSNADTDEGNRKHNHHAFPEHKSTANKENIPIRSQIHAEENNDNNQSITTTTTTAPTQPPNVYPPKQTDPTPTHEHPANLSPPEQGRDLGLRKQTLERRDESFTNNSVENLLESDGQIMDTKKNRLGGHAPVAEASLGKESGQDGNEKGKDAM